MSLTSLFPITRIINLPERKDRRDETMTVFDKFSMNKLNVEFTPALRPLDTGGFESIGAHGCFKSHLKALKEASHLNQPVLIMEDDVNFVPMVHEVTEELLTSADWDILLFGLNEHKVSDDLSLTMVTEDFQQAHCYAVSANALPRLINFLEELLTRQPGDPKGGPMHYDGALNVFRRTTGAVIRCTSNTMATQRSSRSNIAEGNKLDTIPLLRNITAIIRKYKNGY